MILTRTAVNCCLEARRRISANLRTKILSNPIPSARLSTIALLTASVALCFAQVTRADVVHESDVIIHNSACIGFDCVDGESFGSDTIRLNENNLRIHFKDTSASASFPNADWRIIVNDSGNGGSDKFSIENSSAGRTPFTIVGLAPSNSLFVDDSGRIGLGTSAPSVELHIVDGDTPTVRLQQDGSSGFTPQTWDIASNETNFFIRDTTNGSKLPFRIRPNASNDSIVISADGDVLLGTASATAPGSLHIRRNGTEEPSVVMEALTAGVAWEIKTNASTGRMTFKNLRGTNGPNGGPTTPFKFSPTASENLLRVGLPNDNEVNIAGNLVITGDCSEQNGACADYVFDENYKLKSLDELSAFIRENKHLPNVPSADDIEKNGVNMANFSGRLLEKVEELTLYTLQQHELILALQRLSEVEASQRRQQ